jgi:protein TonB
MRIGLPLCFAASFALHAGLMAMSSVWMSSGAALGREKSEREAEELETFEIYLRPPGEGGDRSSGDASAAAGGGKEVERSASDGARANGLASADLADAALAQAPWESSSIAPTSIAESTPEATPGASTTLGANDSAVVPPFESEAGLSAVSMAEPLSSTTTADFPSSSEIEIPAKTALAPSVSAPEKPASAAATQAANSGANVEGIDHGKDSSAGSGVAAGAQVAGSNSAAGSSGTGASAGSGAGGGSRDGDPSGDANGSGHAAPGAVLTFGPRPDYPSQSVRHGEEGRVLCMLHIDARGKVSRVEVLRSSGHDALDDAAVDALMRWKFLPARKDGRAVECRVPHWVTFRLE